MKHVIADDANAATTACLPRDVLANVFLRLPATDLLRLRRVYKEWREIISNPLFVNEHMDHGPWASTHTIVFLGGRSGSGGANGPRDGQGFLLNEHWRVVATFTAGESEELVGTSNGLLCFLDVHHGAINVVEPFTGETLAVPLPPKTEAWDDRSAYCFGFDPSSRRYKIFHQGLDWDTDDSTEQDLYVYTIGGGNNWRSIQVAAGAAAEPAISRCRGLVLADGSLCWSVETTDQLVKLVRFDLATEEIASESVMDFLEVGDQMDTPFHVMTGSNSSAPACVMTIGCFGDCGVFLMGEGGRWARDGRSGVELSGGQHIVLPQALQRGHLLLGDTREGRIYIHPMPPASNHLGSGKLLLKMGQEKDKEPAKSSSTRGLFVPLHLNLQVPAMAGRVPPELITTFSYAPPLSPAPLSRRLGFPSGSP